jgi:hypothetical protein
VRRIKARCSAQGSWRARWTSSPPCTSSTPCWGFSILQCPRVRPPPSGPPRSLSPGQGGIPCGFCHPLRGWIRPDPPPTGQPMPALAPAHPSACSGHHGAFRSGPDLSLPSPPRQAPLAHVSGEGQPNVFVSGGKGGLSAPAPPRPRLGPWAGRWLSASIDTHAPRPSTIAKSSGSAGMSCDLSAAAWGASTPRAFAAHALLRCTAPSSSRLPPRRLPSRHPGAPDKLGKAAGTPRINASAKAWRSIRPNPSLRVSCEGRPGGTSRQPLGPLFPPSPVLDAAQHRAQHDQDNIAELV